MDRATWPFLKMDRATRPFLKTDRATQPFVNINRATSPFLIIDMRYGDPSIQPPSIGEDRPIELAHLSVFHLGLCQRGLGLCQPREGDLSALLTVQNERMECCIFTFKKQHFFFIFFFLLNYTHRTSNDLPYKLVGI